MAEIKVLMFGIAKDIAGAKEVGFDMQEEMKVSVLRQQLLDKFPKLGNLNSFAIAVDNEYAHDDIPLTGNEEVALIPPVSGG